MLIECFIIVPILLSLLMGKRTKKMSYEIYLISFTYWFIASIEAASLLEVSRRSSRYEHIICTVETMTIIVMIVANSYALVTLCSYIIPSSESQNNTKPTIRKFGRLYGSLVLIAGCLFVESPLLIAKLQMIASSKGAVFPGTFYLWMVKNLVFIGLIVFWTVGRWLIKRHSSPIPCRTTLFDTQGVYFQPEKRDFYIQQSRLQNESPVVDVEKGSSDGSLDCKKEPEEKSTKVKKTVRFKFEGVLR